MLRSEMLGQLRQRLQARGISEGLSAGEPALLRRSPSITLPMQLAEAEVASGLLKRSKSASLDSLTSLCNSTDLQQETATIRDVIKPDGVTRRELMSSRGGARLKFNANMDGSYCRSVRSISSDGLPSHDVFRSGRLGANGVTPSLISAENRSIFEKDAADEERLEQMLSASRSKRVMNVSGSLPGGSNGEMPLAAAGRKLVCRLSKSARNWSIIDDSLLPGEAVGESSDAEFLRSRPLCLSDSGASSPRSTITDEEFLASAAFVAAADDPDSYHQSRQSSPRRSTARHVCFADIPDEPLDSPRTPLSSATQYGSGNFQATPSAPKKQARPTGLFQYESLEPIPFILNDQPISMGHAPCAIESACYIN